MSDLQWLICCEGFHLFHKLDLKELTIMCVQTKEFYTFHIKTDSVAQLDFTWPEAQDMFKIELARHGLDLHLGSRTVYDVMKMVTSIIHRYAEVFVSDLALRHMLNTWGLQGVEMLRAPTYESLDRAPATTCGFFNHVTGFMHCSQRRCFELMLYYGPVLVQYLDSTLLTTKLQADGTMEVDVVKYGDPHGLTADFQNLCKIHMPNGALDCQLGMARKDATNAVFEIAIASTASAATEPMDSSSDSAAGAADNQVSRFKHNVGLQNW